MPKRPPVAHTFGDEPYRMPESVGLNITNQYKKLTRRWDSKRELFYDDILRTTGEGGP